MPSDSRALQQADQGVLLEGGDDEQHEVGAVRPRLPHLVAADDEVLAQHRDVDRGATASRSARLPPKRRCSVSTLITLAPPALVLAGQRAGSVIAASAPLLGLPRLTSAMTLMLPGADSTA